MSTTLQATLVSRGCSRRIVPIVRYVPRLPSMVIDPNWFGAPLPDLGRVLAHENGHALSLPHTANMGDLMFLTFEGGGLVLSEAECDQARLEAQKISGTIDKNKKGKRQRRQAPRTRMEVDDLESRLRGLAGIDISEHAVTYENSSLRRTKVTRRERRRRSRCGRQHRSAVAGRERCGLTGVCEQGMCTAASSRRTTVRHRPVELAVHARFHPSNRPHRSLRISKSKWLTARVPGVTLAPCVL